MAHKKMQKCLVCGKITARPRHKYCSNICQQEYQHQAYIRKWQEGKINGLQGLGIVSNHIKRYLRGKFSDKCCLCGWSQKNLVTKQVPLVADHIDGNWRNNAEDNLRLVCPNCDSLSPTYTGLNRGNGRHNRVLSKRAKEGKLLTRKDAEVA